MVIFKLTNAIGSCTVNSKSDPDSTEVSSRRRRFLAALGGTGFTGVLAGCLADDDGGGDETETETATATGTDAGGAAAWELTDLSPADGEIDPTGEYEASVKISNVGDAAGEARVEYRVREETIEERELTLDPGETRLILVSGVEPDTDGETLHHGFYVDDASAEATLSLGAMSQPLPDPDTDYGIAYHPTEAEETIVAPDGWTVELVASEPLIEKPADVKWDAQGRMWVCEMRDFMEHQPADWVTDDDHEEPFDHVPWTDGEESGGNFDRLLSTEPTGDGVSGSSGYAGSGQSGLYDPTHPVWGGEGGDRENLDGWLEEWSNSHEPNGRISILEDVDGDGKYEEATRFLEGLTLPRAFGFVGGSDDEIVVCQTANFDWHEEADVFIAGDSDGDSQSEYREGMIDNYTDEWDIEHTANGMHFMLDNWHWQADASEKFRYLDGQWESADINHTGQWGLGQDEWGRISFGNNRVWGFHHDAPGNGDYFNRGGSGSFGLSSSFGDDDNAWPIRPGYHTVRSYAGNWNMLRDDTTINQPRGGAGTGHYRAGVLPYEYRNDLFMCEPVSNTVARFTPDDLAGMDVSWEQVLYDPPASEFFEEFQEIWNRYHENPPHDDSAPDPSQFAAGDAIDQREFVASVDEFFRPLNVKTGPDGALYIVDMYQNVIQNSWHVQQYITNYTGVMGGFNIPRGGRVYRVYPEGAELRDVPDFTELDPGEIAAHLDDSNGWRRDTAKRVIVQDGLTDAADDVRAVAQESDLPQARIHALWTLHGIDAVDLSSVEANLDHDVPHVVVHAIRTGEQLLDGDDADDYIDAVIEVAGTTDSIRVAVQAAFSLGEVTGEREADVESAFGVLQARWDNGYIDDAIDSSPHYSP